MKHTHSTPDICGRFRRRVIGSLLAFSLALGTIATTATPVEAASFVRGCFQSNKAGFGLAGIPVQLQAFAFGGWHTIATNPLSNAGCVAWTINPDTYNYYLRMVVNYQANGAFWYGASPLLALPGQLGAELGSGVVTCYGCAL